MVSGGVFLARMVTGGPHAADSRAAQLALNSNGCSAALPGFNAVLAHLHGDAAGDPPTMGCNTGNNVDAIDQDAPFLEKFALASNALTRSDDLAVRMTALEADTTNVDAALAKKADATYVAAEFDAVDKRFEEIDAFGAELATAATATPGTAGPNTDPQAGIDDQPTAAPKPGGPATEDGNNPPGAGDGQEGPCPDQQDPPECAAMSPAGCGTLIGQTNVTAVCPNLCSANCNAAATGTGGGDDGDEKSSKLT
eukprot:gene20787-32465_t